VIDKVEIYYSKRGLRIIVNFRQKLNKPKLLSQQTEITIA